ncbi:MAG TPA: DUF308 domain-containing protein [Thermoplasmata archaeon]|nr:DUF308 domain-containing protein [Thermoplasmata archaeon]
MMPSSSGPKLPNWYRGLATLVGLVSIVLAIVVLADPALGLLTLVFLLGFALLVIGIDRIIAGITGHPFGFMPPMMPPAGAPPPGGPKSP